MQDHSWKEIAEAVGLAAASILLGIYLASNSGSLGVQVTMLSFPPATLWLAVRRNGQSPQEAIDPQPIDEARENSTLVAVAQALDVERLVQAS